MYTRTHALTRTHTRIRARSNYQSKDIAHVMKTLAERIADKARTAKDSRSRAYARMALEGLPRGGGNGWVKS